MMKRKIPFLLGIMGILLFASCKSHKNLPYVIDVETLSPEQLAMVSGINEVKIKPNDILNITVNSTIPGAAADFNMEPPTNIGGNSQQSRNIIMLPSGTPSYATRAVGYQVDKNGNIDFPVLGPVKVGDLTIEEAKANLISLIYPKYISQAPIINITIDNFSVSVLGEVARPGVYAADNGQMTIFDALAAAGDMTIYGKRDNVLLLRTNSSGQLQTYRINLQDKNLVLNRDVYYLQQNDKLIVQVNKARGNSSSFGTAESLGLSAISILISVISIVTR